MNKSKNLHELIKSQVNKAAALFTEKDIVENEIKGVFNTIREAMDDEISFTFEGEVDKYGDFVTTIYASNPNIDVKYTVITYDFDNKTIFPVKISNYDDIPTLCFDLDEVNRALESLISSDNFMIRLVTISKERNKKIFGLDEDIPF